MASRGADGVGSPTASTGDAGGAIVVTFADSALEAAVRQVVGLPEGALRAAAPDTVTKLSARERGIADLTGIGRLSRLAVLDLADNAMGTSRRWRVSTARGFST